MPGFLRYIIRDPIFPRAKEIVAKSPKSPKTPATKQSIEPLKSNEKKGEDTGTGCIVRGPIFTRGKEIMAKSCKLPKASSTGKSMESVKSDGKKGDGSITGLASEGIDNTRALAQTGTYSGEKPNEDVSHNRTVLEGRVVDGQKLSGWDEKKVVARVDVRKFGLILENTVGFDIVWLEGQGRGRGSGR